MRNLFYLFIAILAFSCTTEFGQQDSQQQAIQGSYNTFIKVNDYLYAVTNDKLVTILAEKGKELKQIDAQEIGVNIESIHHHDGNLLIGSKTSMYAYEIGDNGIPLRSSNTNYFEFPQQCSSDPIAAVDHYAYVTLSTEARIECSTVQINEIRIYDIKNTGKPELVFTIETDNPKGITIADNHLFVCDGTDGFLVYDITNRTSPVEIGAGTIEAEAYDVVTKNGVLTTFSKDKVNQYDITDVNDIQFLSSIDL